MKISMPLFSGPHVQQIFMHSVTSLPNISSLTALIPDVDKYAERALLLATKQDIICVPCPVEPAYIEFLHELGIEVRPDNIIAESSDWYPSGKTSLAGRFLSNSEVQNALIKRIDRGKTLVLHVFILSETEVALARALEKRAGREIRVMGGNPSIIRKVYAKEFIRAEAQRRNIPVAPGEVVRLPQKRRSISSDTVLLGSAVKRHIGVTGKVLIRGSIGTSGSSIMIIETGEEARIETSLEIILGTNENRVFIVNPLFEPLVSPNILTFISPDTKEISLVCASDQRLNDQLVHKGNIFPSNAQRLPEMIRDSMRLTEWLAVSGLTGFAGFDFIEYRNEKDGNRRYFLTELNPRVNGALYPKALQERIRTIREAANTEPAAFLSANLQTTASCFARLRERYGNRFFNLCSRKGLVPYNTGRLNGSGAVHPFSAVFLGSTREEVQKMHDEFSLFLAEEIP
jgi:hypothetical protein